MYDSSCTVAYLYLYYLVAAHLCTFLKECGSFAHTIFPGKRFHLRTQFPQVNVTFAHIRFSQVNECLRALFSSPSYTSFLVISSPSYTSFSVIFSPSDTSCLIQATIECTRSVVFIRFYTFKKHGDFYIFSLFLKWNISNSPTSRSVNRGNSVVILSILT